MDSDTPHTHTVATVLPRDLEPDATLAARFSGVNEGTASVTPPPYVTFEDVRAATSSYLQPDQITLIESACTLATRAHAGVTRRSGEPYIVHPLTVALLLAQMHLDAVTLIAALLHDVVEDTDITLEQIRSRFGNAVALLVDGVTKFGELGHRQRNWADQARQAGDTEGQRARDKLRRQQAENIKKMFIAMAEDPRVVIVKLADRLHNMRTLDALLPHKQQRIALETREIYAPLAGRLGMGKIKSELEDLAFRYLEPDAYVWLVSQLNDQLTQSERFIEVAREQLESRLAARGISSEVSGRVKHLYSVYKKIASSPAGMDVNHLHDLFALRVIVPSAPPDEFECYKAQSVVHQLWKPIPERFKDYIALPKPNGYQSLHTTVLGDGGRRIEVQIRTREMHEMAEYGLATHWYYKEQGGSRPLPSSLTSWIKMLMTWQDELKQNATEFLDTLKLDIFQDQVFVVSPRGDIIDLPAQSTPIDYAYRVHTELGHRCIGAKVNDVMVTLDYRLKSGDRIEILTTKAAHGPSRDWLNFVVTSGAREKIRQWFKRQHREENVARGREMLERELDRLERRSLASLAHDQLLTVSQVLELKSVDDLYAAIGYGAVGPQQVVTRLHLREAVVELPPVHPHAPVTPQTSNSPFMVMGVGDLLTRIAPCCLPAPGDAIIGYITRNRGVTVHRATCPNVRAEEEKERLVRVEWSVPVTQTLYPVTILVHAWDREGLLRDVSSAVSEERVSIVSAQVSTSNDGVATIRATIRISSTDQLGRVFNRIERVRAVYEVTRETRD